MSSHRRSHGSLAALIHQLEKEQQRRSREAEKWRLKRQGEEDASRAISEQEQLLHDLTAIHENDPIHVNWEEIHQSPAPAEPIYLPIDEDAAKTRFQQFKPSWLDKQFGYKRKLKKLEAQIPAAANRDAKRHADERLRYEKELQTWKLLRQISRGVLDHEPNAYKAAMDYFQLFEAASYYGTSISFALDKETAIADLHVHDTDVIPDHIFSQTSTGKLSKKNMPQSKRNKYYEEHVCSALLKVGRDLLALLPLNAVVVNAMSKRLNSATGRIEDQALVSVLFNATILEELNFSAVNPADAMTNFTHKMKFTNAGGFSAVEKIDLGKMQQLGRGRNNA